MSYQRSRARREFENQLDIAVLELTPLYRLARGSAGGSRILAVYYVFAYSQFEVYLKSFIEDLISTLNTENPSFDKWPDLMLGYLLHKSEALAAGYRRFNHDENEAAILEKLAQTARKIALWSAGAGGVAAADAADFLDKKKYPSPKNLPQLFKRLGITQIWAVIGRAGKMNGELIITSLNDLRTDIAHEGRVPPGFSWVDFKERLAQMQRLVAAIDRGVSGHFCTQMISRGVWNGSMS